MTTEDAPSGNRPEITDSEVIERFGGIRPMAAKLGVAVTTVQGWKERGHIPSSRWQQIAAFAAAHGVDLGAATALPAQEESAATPRDEPPPAVRRPTAAEEEKEVPPPQPAGETPAAVTPPPAKPSESPAAPPERAAPRIFAPGIAWIALFLALGLGVAVLTRPYWESAIHGGGFTGAGGVDSAAVDRILSDMAAMQETVARMERAAGSRGAALEERISALEAGGGEAGAAFAGQLAAIEAHMARLSNTLEAVTGSADQIAQRLTALESLQGRVSEPVQRELAKITAQIDRLQSDLESRQAEVKAGLDAIDKAAGALESRVSELESRPIQTGEKIAALALAVGQLDAALDSGRPYRPALNRLQALGRDDPLIAQSEALTVLAPWADHGIPDRLALQRRFTQITPQIARALAGTDEETWLDSVWNSLRGLITIRRVDGDGELSPVSQAEIAMDRGDLSAAAAALDGAGSLGPEGNAWLSQVRARIAAERELEALYGLVIAPLAGTAEGGAQ